MSPTSRAGAQGWALAICLLGGVLLTIIGILYLVSPDVAARTFGLGSVHLGLLAIALRFAAMPRVGALVWHGQHRMLGRRSHRRHIER